MREHPDTEGRGAGADAPGGPRPGRAAALLLAALALAACGNDGPTGTPQPRTIDVEVVDFSFQPSSVEARVGDTIRWTQRGDAPHTATSGEPGSPDAGSLFDEGLEETGDVEQVTVSRAGTIPYFCRPHPVMTGAITVRP